MRALQSTYGAKEGDHHNVPNKKKSLGVILPNILTNILVLGFLQFDMFGYYSLQLNNHTTDMPADARHIISIYYLSTS